MTIEMQWEVNCDACGDTHIEEDIYCKTHVLRYLKKHGWKNHKQFTWCPDCVKRGHYKAGYVDWLENPVK